MGRKLLALAATFLVAVGAGIDTIVQKATQGHPHARHAIYAVENEATRLVREGLVAATGSCGIERWPEKTLATSDPASAPLLAGTPSPTNIPGLVAMSLPGGQSPTGDRISGAEQTVWKLAGSWLVSYKLEADSDIHLVLRSAIDPTKTLISEIPDSGCASNPVAAARIAEARDAFVREVGQPLGYYQDTRRRVTLSGAGFFDFIHGQNGVAPNGIEIHPVLSFQAWASR